MVSPEQLRAFFHLLEHRRRPRRTATLLSSIHELLQNSGSWATKCLKLPRCYEICRWIHIFWVRNVSIATIHKDKAAIKAAKSKVVANAHLIAAAIEPFYGATAREHFFKPLASHYGTVSAYLAAAMTGDVSGQAAAMQSLTINAEEIAVFLSKANPDLPRDAMNSLLLGHGAHHVQQIQRMQDGDYDSEAKIWEEIKDHAYQIADATADALGRQFEERFRYRQ